MDVQIKQGHGVYVRQGHDVVWQEPVSVVTTHTGARIRIDGTRSEMITSHGVSNVSDDVPAVVGRDHDAIVEYWQLVAEGWAASAAYLGTRVMTDRGVLIDAPGFDGYDQLEAFATRGKAAQLRTWPAANGIVMVSSSRGGKYSVSRTSCECAGHATHGRCMHRALCVYLNDVEGVNVCQVSTIGSDQTGVTMAVGPIPAAEAA